MTIPTITNETIFTSDWSANDPRSVKAYLSGKGDGRTLWWLLNHRVHKFLWPNDTLERVMYSFHCRQHWGTIASFRYVSNVHEVSHAILRHGLVAGMLKAISVTKNSTR